jgi:CheY-like chemotaxis protein
MLPGYRMDNMAAKPLSVLVVDDHRDTTGLLARLLILKGHDATAVASFRDAVVAARTDHFDLVLCDMTLPDGDGCELLAALRALQPLKGIAMSGYTSEDDRRRCARAGYQMFLSKPFTFETLEGAIAQVMAATPECDHSAHLNRHV